MKFLSIREATAADLELASPQLPAYASSTLLGAGRAYALVGEAGELVFIFGVSLVNHRTGEAWSIPTPAARNYLGAPAAIKRTIAAAVRELGLRRLYSMVFETEKTSRAFSKYMGFRDEAFLAEFGESGEGVYIMRWNNGS